MYGLLSNPYGHQNEYIGYLADLSIFVVSPTVMDKKHDTTYLPPVLVSVDYELRWKCLPDSWASSQRISVLILGYKNTANWPQEFCTN